MPIEPASRRHLELSEILNRVLDRGVVIAGDVTISVADIDLIQLGLTVVLSAVESRGRSPAELPANADLAVLPPRSAE